MKNETALGHVLTLMTIIIWGTTFVSTKVLLEAFTPIEILFFRFTLGYLRYLETIRIAKARKLLERNVPMIEVALQTGFADQSHFSRFFKRLIGVTPRQYAEIFGGRQA